MDEFSDILCHFGLIRVKLTSKRRFSRCKNSLSLICDSKIDKDIEINERLGLYEDMFIYQLLQILQLRICLVPDL